MLFRPIISLNNVEHLPSWSLVIPQLNQWKKMKNSLDGQIIRVFISVIKIIILKIYFI